MKFTIDKNIEPGPTPPRGRGGSKGYAFDVLEIGESQHIPATKKRPDPCKSLAASVCAANKRYAQERKFIIRRVDSNDERGCGARIFRV